MVVVCHDVTITIECERNEVVLSYQILKLSFVCSQFCSVVLQIFFVERRIENPKETEEKKNHQTNTNTIQISAT